MRPPVVLSGCHGVLCTASGFITHISEHSYMETTLHGFPTREHQSDTHSCARLAFTLKYCTNHAVVTIHYGALSFVRVVGTKWHVTTSFICTQPAYTACSILDTSSFPGSFMDNELLLTCFCGTANLLEVWYARTSSEFQKPDFNRDTQIRLNFFVLALNCNYSDYEVREPRLSKSKMSSSAVLQKRTTL